MARALDHLYEKNIMHRDLKTANIFLCENGQIKIGDLNVSVVTKDNLAKT